MVFARLLGTRQRIRDYLAFQCADETAVNDILSAVEEACSNAIRHSDSPEHIEVRVSTQDDRLEATVTDRGCGFDTERFDSWRLPDPRADHGRGLFLMAKLCDETRLCCDGGIEVRLAKRAVRL